MLCGLVEIIIQKVQGVSLGISVLRSLRLLRIFKVTRYDKDTRAGQLKLENYKDLTLSWTALLALNCYSYGSSKDHLALIQCSFCIFIIRVRFAFSLVASCVLFCGSSHDFCQVYYNIKQIDFIFFVLLYCNKSQMTLACEE